MPEFATAYIHRIDGKTVTPPRQWTIPGAALLRFVVGVWPATLTVLGIASIVVTNIR